MANPEIPPPNRLEEVLTGAVILLIPIAGVGLLGGGWLTAALMRDVVNGVLGVLARGFVPFAVFAFAASLTWLVFAFRELRRPPGSRRPAPLVAFGLLAIGVGFLLLL